MSPAVRPSSQASQWLCAVALGLVFVAPPAGAQGPLRSGLTPQTPRPAWVQALGYANGELIPIVVGEYGYPFLRASIDGVPLDLPFDTGNMVGLTLSPANIARLGLPKIGAWTSLDSNGAPLGRRRMFRARDVQVFTSEIATDSVYELVHPTLPGLVGPTRLLGKHFTIDYANGLMAVSDRPLRATTWQQLPLVHSTRLPALLLVEGRVQGRRVLFQLDTGKSRSTIDPELARELGLTLDENGARNVELELGPYSFVVPSAKLVSLREIDSTLSAPIVIGVGSDLLRQFVWTIDYQRGVMLFPPG